MKTNKTKYEQKIRLWYACMAQGRRDAKTLHPETGGNPTLVHNWGNEAAKAAWGRAWNRWYRIEVIYRNLGEAEA